MKLFLVIFGLFATVWATAPVTPVVKNKLSQCLTSVGLIVLPEIELNVSILLLGLVKVYVDVDVDCTKIAAIINLAVEKTYTETTAGGVVSFSLDLEAVAVVDLELHATVIVQTILGIQLGIGGCVLGYVNVIIDITVTGTFPVGQPSQCNINYVNCGCRRSNWHITPSGPPIIATVCGLLGASITAIAFASLQVCINAVLVAGLI